MDAPDLTQEGLAARDVPERMFVRGKPNGAMGRWHDATSLPETAAMTSGGSNPMHSYILATPAALAASPEVQALISRAILDAQLRCMERGRLDTPDEIRAAADALRKDEEPK